MLLTDILDTWRLPLLLTLLFTALALAAGAGVRRLARARRRALVAGLNRDLELPIAPLLLSRRRRLIAQILADREVVAAIEAEAKAAGIAIDTARAKARRFASEITPAFNARVYFWIGTTAAKWISDFLYDVELIETPPAAADLIAKDACAVFVMNHRSNVDYILLTDLARNRSALSYAVGEWARLPVLASLIHLMGAYFVRRDNAGTLYRRTLAAYVRIATRARVTQAVFPEGGLSRDGALSPPKLGILTYIATAFDPDGQGDIVFVPTGIAYDRVIEDRVLTAAAGEAHSARNFRFSALTTIGFALKTAFGRLTGTRAKFGRAALSFGHPVSLRTYLRNRGLDLRRLSPDALRAEMERLAGRLIGEIGQVVPVLPTALVALALLEAERASARPAVPVPEIAERVRLMVSRLKGRHARLLEPSEAEATTSAGIESLKLRGLIEAADGGVRTVPGNAGIVAYYANGIVHHFRQTPFPVGGEA